jgi:inner membrane protein
MQPVVTPEPKRWTDNNLVKVGIIGFLILALMIPSFMIMALVRERSGRQWEVSQEVSSKWGQMQTMVGPYIAIPYMEEVKFNNNTGTVSEWRQFAFYYFPEKLSIHGTLDPFVKKRSIFNVLLYETDIELKCTFAKPDFASLQIDSSQLQWEKASLHLGVTDLTGIGSQVWAKVMNDSIIMTASAGQFTDMPGGLRCPVDASLLQSTPWDLSVAINLKGSQGIYFTPVAKANEVHLTSTWSSPKFTGRFLPDSSTITNKGFEANWNILDVNRPIAQQWTSQTPQHFQTVAASRHSTPYMVNESTTPSNAFGVELMATVDHYTKTERTVKYAILLISLTFAVYFFCEILKKQKVHPLQYGLIGAALVIFFILLLSFSEHIGFDMAYLASSAATIGLITLYSSSIFVSKQYAPLVGGMLVILFGFIYIILQLEDYALLAGSLGLFSIVALIMYLTRRVRW